MAIRTVIDSCVLRAAFEGEEGESNRKALEILDDVNREFVAVAFVELETIPKPVFHKKIEQALLFQEFFDNAPVHTEVSSDVTTLAMRLASEHDIGPMDALIISSAIIGGADEVVTMEKPTKPMFSVTAVKVTSLQ